MPTYRRRTTRVSRRPSHRRGRRMRGRGFMDFISKAGDFLKKSKKSARQFEAIESLKKIKSFLLEIKAGLSVSSES